MERMERRWSECPPLWGGMAPLAPAPKWVSFAFGHGGLPRQVGRIRPSADGSLSISWGFYDHNSSRKKHSSVRS